MSAEDVPIDPTRPFEEIEAEDRRRVVIEHARPSVIAFFLVASYVGVVEWITRPTHRAALVLVGAGYALIAGVCLALLRWRPHWAVPIAVGGVSTVCAAMLSYSPMVRGSGELCVLAIGVLLGAFTVMFPLGLRCQVLASIVPVIGYAAVLQLGTTTAYPVWYSGSALFTLLFILAVGARSMDRDRSRVLRGAFHQAALATENSRLWDEARAADRAKSDLMSILAHELRSPLGSIKNFSEILLARPGTPADEVRATLQRIASQSIGALDLVHTMLEFGRIESGRLQISIEDFDVAEMIEGVRAELPAAWRRADVPVVWNNAPRGLRMRSDRSKVEAIVRNLVHNALKHTLAGTVSVTVTGDAARQAVRFRVTDTGEGITPEALPQIFDRFSRGVSASGGFGLGLFIVKRFAEALGGEVSVESIAGQGSRFEAIVPLQAPAATLDVSAPRAA